MSEDNKGPAADAAARTTAGDPAAADAKPATSQGPAPGTTEGRPDAAQLEAIVRALQDELSTHNDTNLRLRAEMENLRKRFEREKAETAKYAITKFAQDVVNLGDNFGRIVTAIPTTTAENDPTLKSFLDGVLLAEREFINVLQRHGVVRIDPQGQPFDPKVHNAVMEQEDRDVPSGTVLKVFQAGYLIEDRCLKPALVVVSRGGPKAGKTEPDAPSAVPGVNGGQDGGRVSGEPNGGEPGPGT